jgi:beta-galactosidase/beta-glucuronidase
MSMLFPNSRRQLAQIQGAWFFKIDVDQIGEQNEWYAPTTDCSTWSAVPVPSAWNLYTEALWGYEGVGWYVTDLSAQTSQPGFRHRLHFGRVAWHAKVWLNGHLLGEHLGGDLPFEFDVTGLLNFDLPNRLAVRVDNAPRLEWLPGSLVIERVTYGGIISPVLLETLADTCVDTFHVKSVPDGTGALVCCNARVRHTGTQEFHGTLKITIPVPGGPVATQVAVHCQPGETLVSLPELRLSSAQPWSPDEPVLYPIQASIFGQDGQLVDEIYTRFGIRTIKTHGQHILLNGEPIFIRGVDLYVEYPDAGPVASRQQIYTDLMEIKKTGANFIRFPCPVEPIVFDLMDEIGLMGDEEVYINWWGADFWPGTFPAEQNAAAIVAEGGQWLRQMIDRDFNHPCIIAWAMANESATHEPAGIEAMRRLMSLSHELDTTRLVTFIAAGDARQHLAFDEADLVAANLYQGVFSPQPAQTIADIESMAKQPTIQWLQWYSTHFSDKPIIISEFGAHGISTLYGDSRCTEDHQAAYIQAIWEAITSVPGIQGGVLWCWADYHHRRNFFGTGLTSPFGPFGVMTANRKPKRSHATLKKVYGG